MDILELNGKWRSALRLFGLRDSELSGRHGPCPLCGGKDRFRFDNKNGTGSYFCNKCGAGTGIQLMMRFLDCSYREAIEKLEKVKVHLVADTPVAKDHTDDEDAARALLNGYWKASRPAGDIVRSYLASRGWNGPIPKDLREHSPVPYIEDGKRIGEFPMMLAMIRNKTGLPLNLHRTYLTPDGHKAPVLRPKKLGPVLSANGGAIRLFVIPTNGHIGIAEGIETALAASVIHEIPTWASVTAYGMEQFLIPKGVSKVTVFADNDTSYTGIKAAAALAFKVKALGKDSEIRIPIKENTDFADMILRAREEWNDYITF